MTNFNSGHFSDGEVCPGVSEIPIVGVEPVIQTGQRVTESGSGEESPTATAGTNVQTAMNTTGKSVIPTTPQLRRSGLVRKPVQRLDM